LIDLEKAHAFGFQPQGELQLVGGESLDIDGLIEGGIGIAVAAAAADKVEVIGPAKAIGAAKHHVFEHVSEALALGPFVLGADVIPEMNGHNGAGRVLERDDLEAVGQGDLPIIVQFAGGVEDADKSEKGAGCRREGNGKPAIHDVRCSE
jgi:hypothetical protein